MNNMSAVRLFHFERRSAQCLKMVSPCAQLRDRIRELRRRLREFGETVKPVFVFLRYGEASAEFSKLVLRPHGD